MNCVGLLTIGQSPRPDLCEALVAALPPGTRTIERGVLDGLTHEQVVRDFTPGAGEFPLISRMADGRTVTLGETAVTARMQAGVDALENDGASLIVVMCTGSFPALRTRRAWLVEPDRVVLSTVASLLRGQPLGLLAPLPAQIDAIDDKWAGAAARRSVAAASPYGPLEDLVVAGLTLRNRGAQALVLDCMGYGERHKRALARLGLPVFVSGSVLAAGIGTMLA